MSETYVPVQGKHRHLAMPFACTVGILMLVLHHNVENLKFFFSKSQISGVCPKGGGGGGGGMIAVGIDSYIIHKIEYIEYKK